jgi:hypothetical protein
MMDVARHLLYVIQTDAPADWKEAGMGSRLDSLLSNIVHFFKVRYYAKPFDIHKECQDNTRKADNFLSGDWISYDGKLYYGNPWFVFFKSAQNSWWLNQQLTNPPHPRR